MIKKKKHYKRLLIRKALLSKMPIQKKYLNICTSHEHKHSFYYFSFNKSGWLLLSKMTSHILVKKIEHLGIWTQTCFSLVFINLGNYTCNCCQKWQFILNTWACEYKHFFHCFFFLILIIIHVTAVKNDNSFRTHGLMIFIVFFFNKSG